MKALPHLVFHSLNSSSFLKLIEFVSSAGFRLQAAANLFQ